MKMYSKVFARAWVAVVLATTAPAAAADHFVDRSEDGTTAYVFNVPTCIPDCDRDDQRLLTGASLIEQEFIAAIDSARESVHFSQYTFSRKPILDALTRARIRGVQVRGVVDRGQIRTIGEFCEGQTCSILPTPFNSDRYKSGTPEERLAIAEGTELYSAASNSEKLAILLVDSPDGSGMMFPGGSRLMHHKFAVIDGSLLLSGSGNWSSTAVSVNLENLTVSRNTEVVNAFSCAFTAMWGNPSQRNEATAACQTDSIFFTPVGAGSNRIVEEIVTSIENARQSIDVAMHHLVHPAVLFELTRAGQRGVQVRLVTDDDLCIQRMTPEFRDLVGAGAKIRYVPTTCSMFQLSHNKFAVFDGKKLINGSGNWSRAGLERNFENFKSTTDNFSVGTFHTAFEKFWGLGVERSSCSCDRSQASCQEQYCLGSVR